MAYIIGLFTPEEQAELEELGWEFEDAPKELIDPEAHYDAERMKMVWVDTDAYKVMTGPDWDGSTPHAVVAGNLSDGFELYGPYGSFDEAVADTDYGSETWVMSMRAPGTMKTARADQDLDENWKACLQPGDEVTWNDPDEGKCSGVYKIVDITVFGPEEECPNCHCGMLGLENGVLTCRGECGHTFGSPDMDDAVFSLKNEAGSEVEAFGRELS